MNKIGDARTSSIFIKVILKSRFLSLVDREN